MATYEITQPPHGKRCDTDWCGQPAEVRLIIPREMVSQIGSDEPVTQDRCAVCWDELRGQLIARGHKITDITGSAEQLRAEFHEVGVFCSDEGVLYATVHRRTYHAYLASQLRAQLEAVTMHVIGMPGGA
jgi:hypothetical protein